MMFTVENCPVIAHPDTGQPSDKAAMLYYLYIVQRTHPQWFEMLGFLKLGQ